MCYLRGHGIRNHLNATTTTTKCLRMFEKEPACGAAWQGLPFSDGVPVPDCGLLYRHYGIPSLAL